MTAYSVVRDNKLTSFGIPIYRGRPVTIRMTCQLGPWAIDSVRLGEFGTFTRGEPLPGWQMEPSGVDGPVPTIISPNGMRYAWVDYTEGDGRSWDRDGYIVPWTVVAAWASKRPWPYPGYPDKVREAAEQLAQRPQEA